MFLNNLTLEQKKAFLSVAMKIMKADGRLDARERDMVEGMRYEMGLWNETVLPKGFLEELVKPFDTRKSRIILLLESIALAYSDDDFADEEKKILRQMAILFEFNEEEATKIEGWVLRFRTLQQEAVEMFS